MYMLLCVVFLIFPLNFKYLDKNKEFPANLIYFFPI